MSSKRENNRQSRVGLLVVDVQQGLSEHPTPVFQAERLLDCLTTLIDEARRKDAPVFFIQHANKGTLAPGSAAWQFHPRLRPQAGEVVIHKRQGDAFQGTNLREALEARGVSEVVVVGLVTHGCVQATCMGAMRSGYRVILAQDGHSSYHKQAAELIATWNQKLQARGVVLKRAQEIEFGKQAANNPAERYGLLSLPGAGDGASN